MELLPLAPDEVHLWVASPSEWTSAQLAEDEVLLSPEERARHRRFRFEKDRRTFLVAHALVRRLLSRYVPIGPSAWCFETGPHGRPEPRLPEGAPRLRFNLSHTEGLVACGVGWERELGVDVESVRSDRVRLEFAEQHFAPAEIRQLKTLKGPAQVGRFFDLWTLKEAYLKARGVGLALPLGGFCFKVEPTIEVAFDARVDDDPAGWQFRQWSPTPEHRMALAVRAPGPVRVRVLRFSPEPD